MKDNKGYPRDMAGYGRTPPFADWPNNARLAVQFVINYEEGAENNILHGDAGSETFLSMSDPDAETRTALAEIDRIAALRLKDILP